jgi:hypothetical protein
LTVKRGESSGNIAQPLEFGKGGEGGNSELGVRHNSGKLVKGLIFLVAKYIHTYIFRK